MAYFRVCMTTNKTPTAKSQMKFTINSYGLVNFISGYFASYHLPHVTMTNVN